MLLSAGIRPLSANHSPNIQVKLSQSPVVSAPKSLSISRKFEPRRIKISASSSSQALESVNDKIRAKEKLRVVVKPMGRPRLVLKFIWMENNIGIAIDQVIPGGHGTIPLSPYYFWPRKDAWEELKVMLERKPWISNKQKVALLNHATDIINLWQQRGQGN